MNLRFGFRLLPVMTTVALSLGVAAVSSGCSDDDSSSSGDGGSSSTGGKGGAAATGGKGGTSSTGGKSGGSSTGGTSDDGGLCASPGGPTDDPKEAHCEGDAGKIVQEVGKCVTGAEEEGDGGGDVEEYPGPWGGNSAADDDCKYDVSFTNTPICENSDTTFTVTVKTRSDGKAVTGASPELEVLDPKGLPAAEGDLPATEKSDGVYEIEKIKFNQSGKWTIRFHLFENCSDTPEDSPHGHAAFFIDVP